jgi:hypothetical protein
MASLDAICLVDLVEVMSVGLFDRVSFESLNWWMVIQ